MRVLTVGNMYPPHHFGGYELVWRSAVESLRAGGHDVRVLTTDTDTGAREPDDPDVHRELHWHLRSGEFAPQTLHERWRMARHNQDVLERHLLDQAPEVVAWWSMGGLTLAMVEIVRRRGLPGVAFVHDEWLDYGRWADGWLRTFLGPRRGRLARIGERLGGIPASVRFAEAAEYVFVSEHTRRRARELDLGLERTSIAHSGIHPDFLDPAPERDWGWQLLYVGRLDARKGVDTAIRALAELPPAARLTIAGGWDQAEEARLRAMTAEAGVESRVVFAGQLERSELLGHYEQCDAVLFPVRWDEPWGLVPLEAMGRGRPAIATGRGGSGEYLRDEQNCLLFDAESPRELASAIVRLAAEPDLRARLREGGFATAPRHTEAVFNEAAEAALRRAVRSEGPVKDRCPPKVLHIGSGFRPLRQGGLVAYIEDLMHEQMLRGAEVSYLFTGRYYPWSRGPRLKRWRRRGVEMLEIVSSPLCDHGFQPLLEIAEPCVEAIVEAALARVEPDVVHVHELAGFPLSVLDVLKRSGTPTVMTLQDYFAVCPTFKLLDSTGQTCLRRQLGSDCVATVAQDPRAPGLLHHATLLHDMRSSRLIGRILRSDESKRGLADVAMRAVKRDPHQGMTDPGAYQRRRDQAIERLNGVDRLVSMSSRVTEIYEALGVDPARLRTEQLTLAHIEGLRPRRATGDGPVVFATLGGGESEAKGARVLIDAAAMLADLAAAGRVRLLVLGTVASWVAEEARNTPWIEFPGRYAAHEQDRVLDEVDVGIVPSVWEEAYAYAGVEFLAKGIPVIANAIGGMVDYVRDGETGWLNRPCNAAGLAEIMREIAERPQQIVALNEHLRDARPNLVLSMREHAEHTESLYRELIG